MLEKIRPNAIIFGIILAALFYLVVKDVAPVALDGIIEFAAGVVLGALATGFTKVLEDPPPPVVPAFIVEKMLNCQACVADDDDDNEPTLT